MKKILTTIAALSIAAIVHAGAPAQWNQPAATNVGNWYIGAYGGMNFAQKGINGWNYLDYESTSKKIGWNAGLKVGYDFDPAAWVRPVLEAEVAFSSFNQNLNNGDTGSSTLESNKLNTFTGTLMVNALAKFDAGFCQPYIGAGAGFYHMSMDVKYSYDNDSFNKDFTTASTGFAWQLIAGADVKIDANWAVFTEYKWVNLQIVDAKNKPFKERNFLKSRMSQHQVNLGVRYSF